MFGADEASLLFSLAGHKSCEENSLKICMFHRCCWMAFDVLERLHFTWNFEMKNGQRWVRIAKLSTLNQCATAPLPVDELQTISFRIIVSQFTEKLVNAYTIHCFINRVSSSIPLQSFSPISAHRWTHKMIKLCSRGNQQIMIFYRNGYIWTHGHICQHVDPILRLSFPYSVHTTATRTTKMFINQ